ncbi:MAG: DUF5723 family protein [Bacteroidota bacterium]|nr:DUF5723 family protein [Bacteroidota bacterium]
MKLFYIFTLLLFSTSLFAQLEVDPYFQKIESETGNENYISFGSSMFSSPTVEFSRMNYFLLTQFGDRDYKNKILSGLKDENLMGTEFENYILYSPAISDVFGFKDYSISFLLKSVYQQSLFVTDDFVNIFFHGNSSFAGKTAELSPLNYKNYLYHEMQINLNKKSENNLCYGFGLSLISASILNEFIVSDASLFTSEEGDSLYANLNVSIRRNNPSKNDLFAVNGLGTALNLYASYEFENKNSFFVAIDNLGFINYNKNTNYFEIDTGISFTGFDVFDEELFEENSENNSFLDTFNNLDNFGLNESYLSFLQPRLKLIYSIKNVYKEFDVNTGLIYVLSKHRTPFVFANLNYSINEKILISSGLSFDQYRKTAFNLGMKMKLLKNAELTFGSYHLEGFGISRTNGFNFYLGFNSCF